jgi:hypothetical protein
LSEKKIEGILSDTTKAAISEYFGTSSAPTKKQIAQFFQERLATGQKIEVARSEINVAIRMFEHLQQKLST